MNVSESQPMLNASNSWSTNGWLCSSCGELFLQPSNEPDADEDQDPSETPYRRSGKAILSSAQAGCPVCTIAWTTLSEIFRRTDDLERLMVSPSLHWYGEEGRFSCVWYWARGNGKVYPELFFIDLDRESETSDCVPEHLRPPDTESNHCRSLASRWILECLATHEECRSSNQGSWLPTRLIDVGRNWPSVMPRVVLTSGFPSQQSAPLYICLSHLWAAESVLRLTTTNQTQLMQALPLDNLSPTFRDAITFTRELGIRFLWIDSLCILQDSRDDWLAESALMDRVYKYSVCNLAATAASNSSPGLFQRRDARLIAPYTILIQRKGHEVSYILSLGSRSYDAVAKARLNSRGWVFQERLLSPRTLHFSSQLLWECLTLRASETFPTGHPSIRDGTLDKYGTELPDHKLWARGVQEDAASIWAVVVKAYCMTRLTRPPDRLAALAGIAQEMHSKTNYEYLAGLWRQHLLSQLCWTLTCTQETDYVSRPTEYRCPSWSWASLDFPGDVIVEIPEPGVIKRHVATVVDAAVESSSGNVFSHVTNGYVRIQGKLGKVRLNRLGDADGRGDRGGHQTYEIDLDTTEGPDHEDMMTYRSRRSGLCIPIMTYDMSNPGTFESLQVFCLLLKRVDRQGTEMKYKRIGWMSVLYDWKDEIHPELKWITDFAQSNSWASEGQDVVTII